MHSIENCIPKAFLMPKNLLDKAKEIITWVGYYKQTGRPLINGENVVQALYYLVRTGMQWKALPRCFWPASTIHAAFQMSCVLPLPLSDYDQSLVYQLFIDSKEIYCMLSTQHLTKLQISCTY